MEKRNNGITVVTLVTLNQIIHTYIYTYTHTPLTTQKHTQINKEVEKRYIGVSDSIKRNIYDA